MGYNFKIRADCFVIGLWRKIDNSKVDVLKHSIFILFLKQVL